MRYRNVIIAGAIAGFGGSWFASNVGKFNQNMTGGRGFIALAVVIVGRWHPIGALCAALVFGLFDSLADKLAFLNTGIPSEFIAMLPYLATIVVVVRLRRPQPRPEGRRPAVRVAVGTSSRR